MLTLPGKFSRKWIFVLSAIFLVTLLSLLLLANILKLDIAAENIGGFALLSALSAAAISLGGFIGAKTYFKIALIFDILGLAYMLYVALNKTAEGWSDLVSIISYMFVAGIGVILGIVVQAIQVLVHRKKQGTV